MLVSRIRQELYKYWFGLRSVIQYSRENPIPKYEEMFPPTEFRDIVNDKNRIRVTRLDELVMTANTNLTRDDCSVEELIPILVRAFGIIYAREGRVMLRRAICDSWDKLIKEL